MSHGRDLRLEPTKFARKPHLLVIIVLAASLGLHVSARPAGACSCVFQTSVQHAANADVIFAGRLLEIDEGVRGPIFSSMDPITYRFEVDRVLKGAVSKSASVVSAASGGSCGLEQMNVGERYTIFAQGGAGSLRSGLCGGTHTGDPDPAVAVMSGLVLPPVAGAPPGWVFVAAALAVVLMILAARETLRRRRQGSPPSAGTSASSP
jgi:hypothetical protein